MLCSKCGMENNNLEQLCKYCGTPLQNSQQIIDNKTDNDIQTMNSSYEQQSVNTNSTSINNTINTNDNMYKLTLTRPNSFVGMLWNLKIDIDNERKCVLKNNETVTLNVKGGNHHISFSGYSEYTIQVLSDATANVIITDSAQVLLQDLNGINVIEDNNSYNNKLLYVSRLILSSSMILLMLAIVFTQFMSNINALLFGIAIDIIITFIGIYLTNKQKSKLGHSFKRAMYDYIGTIVINIFSIIACIIIKGF